MTELSEHDQYVTKINSLVESGRDDLVDEVAAEHIRAVPSGRDAFWATTRPGGWLARSLLDAGEPAHGEVVDPGSGVVLRLSVDVADQWDRRDLLRD